MNNIYIYIHFRDEPETHNAKTQTNDEKSDHDRNTTKSLREAIKNDTQRG